MVIDDTGSVEDIHAFIYCKKWRFGKVLPMPDRLTTLKDSATQLLIKYKSGALVTQHKYTWEKEQIDIPDAHSRDYYKIPIVNLKGHQSSGAWAPMFLTDYQVLEIQILI